MKKIVASVTSEAIRQSYKKLDVDVDRFLREIEKFDLVEDEAGLRRWDPCVPGDGKFYEQLSIHPWYYAIEKDEFAIARKLIGRASVLEVGCGSGFFADGASCSAYVGLELNGHAASQARAKGHDVREVLFNEYADEHPASVDVVCSFQVLEHLIDPAEYFLDALKVLKHGGRIVTSVPSEDSFVGSIFDNPLNAPPHHLTRWSDQALRAFPLSLGIDCIDIIHLPVEQQHYRWFWASLLRRGMLENDSADGIGPVSRIAKLKTKMAMTALSALGFNFTIPKDFHIPGHTVMAIHKKQDV